MADAMTERTKNCLLLPSSPRQSRFGIRSSNIRRSTRHILLLALVLVASRNSNSSSSCNKSEVDTRVRPMTSRLGPASLQYSSVSYCRSRMSDTNTNPSKEQEQVQLWKSRPTTVANQ
ncbi:hypothetical protein BCV70DRAFT_199079 [Testicularia cyperi]|uniref:Uncharacterized protein n=1 Tax=Testicularia cyperi TaxID=1882483 RepID=A0A317XUB1_9BASI|nr:hypothetical protein BCV70DRAFT_199079 [Testicularia cyperi]